MIRSIAASGVATWWNTRFPARAQCFMLWSAALILGGCESAITYDAMVGLNWALPVLGTTGSLLIGSWRAQSLSLEQRCAPVSLATLLAIALAITADPAWQFLIAVALIATLSVQVLGLLGHGYQTIGLLGLVFAPFKSASGVLHECARRTRQLFEQISIEASLPVIRTIALALPVAIILGLILSGADPTFATWRDAIVMNLSLTSVIPRVAWFAILSALTLGGLGLALQPRPVISVKPPLDYPGLRFSRTDQVAVLGSAAAVFAAYLALQVSYLFGNTGALAGSHVTYAEAVHRGFVEINVAVTLSGFLIVTLLSRSATKPLPGWSKAVTVALMLESQILALSAWHRVRLYEAAYGYTEQRLLVGVYAIAAVVVLAMLGREILGNPDFRRLVRQTGALGILALCGLVFWNHEAWIVRANVARYHRTGQLDANYLIFDLGADGLPQLARSLPSVDPLRRVEIGKCIGWVGATKYSPAIRYHWFEWTARRAALREMFEQYRSPAGANEPPRARIDCNQVASVRMSPETG